jgi:L-alanine-DL-glutamate epimerase-like enolase superfamily enzyme
MKITDVKAIQLAKKFSRPQRIGSVTRNQRRFTFVVVTTDEGIIGVGDAFGNQALMETIVEKHLKSLALGLDPFDVEGLWKKLYEGSFFWEVGGSVVCGISAVEVACWDIQGKARGVPVSELLGGAKRNWVEAYASDLHQDDPAYMADLARSFADAGFRVVKTHIGSEPEEDLRRVEAIRKAIGPEIGLMIDLNTGLDRQTALNRGLQYLPYAPFWLEEPISPVDFEGHAWLREWLPTPIAAGENLFTLRGFEPMLAAKGCDYLMPDILRCGGLRQAQMICQAAERHGVIATPHNFSSGVGLAATLHLMAAMPRTQLLEYDPTGTSIYEELFVEPLKVEGNRVRVPTGPGLGVKLTEEMIVRYRL